MPWQYRVVHRSFLTLDETDEHFGIYEIQYDSDGTIVSWLSTGSEPSGESIADLQKTLQGMLRALQQPVVEWSELEALAKRPAEMEDAPPYIVEVPPDVFDRRKRK